MTGLTETGAGGAYRLYDTILTVTDRFSGMFWALPCNIRISARETAQMVLQRIILEEARGYCINWICDRDQRFLGEACAQGKFFRGPKKIHSKTLRKFPP